MNRTFLGRTATCSPPACARHARSAGPLTQGPGGIGAISPGSDGVLCKAFNDYYFTALANQGPRGAALAQTIAREVPIVIGAAGGVQMLETAAMAATPAGLAAQALTGSVALLRASAAVGTMSWGAFRWRSLTASWRAGGIGGRLRFPDGMSNGMPIEIKGPGDTPSFNQMSDYSKLTPRGKVIEISCESCGNDCSDRNRCPLPPTTP